MYKYATRNFGYLPTSSSAFSKECERMLHSACLLTSFITPPRIFNTFYWFAAHYSLSAFFHRKKRYERSIAIPMSVVWLAHSTRMYEIAKAGNATTKTMKTTYSRVALIEIKTIKDYVTEKRTRLWRKRAKRSASSKTKCNKRSLTQLTDVTHEQTWAGNNTRDFNQLVLIT